jgi:hypothetical protein
VKPCECGCGTLIAEYDQRGRGPRRYARNHHRTGKSNVAKIKPVVLKRTAHERACKAVRQRDRCELSCIGDCKGRLDVAHLDGDPWNNDPANLRTLCRSHHFLLDRGRIDWTKPAMPAFRVDGAGKRRYATA